MATGIYPMPLNAQLANIDLGNVQYINGVSINTLTSGGVYFLWEGNDLPEGSHGYVIVIAGFRPGISSAYLKQIFIKIGTVSSSATLGDMWIRSKIGSGDWDSWWKIYGTKGSELGQLSLSSYCTSRGTTYVARYGAMMMVHFSVRTSSAVTNQTLATFPSGMPTNHVAVSNYLCLTDDFTKSYTVDISGGVIKASSSIPTNTQLFADIPLVLT